MVSKIKKLMLNLFLMIGLSLIILCLGLYAEMSDMGGWEKDGKYNRFYDANDMDDFKGTVLRIKKVVPLPGMSPGVALEIRVAESEVVLVHLCPVWFADPKSIGVKKGEKVRIKGAWADINGKEVFMASKVKKGDYFEFKLRLTKDGTPFWTLSPEELKRERAESQKSLKK